MTDTPSSTHSSERRHGGDRRKISREGLNLSETVTVCLENYFKDMDGHTPGNLYELMLAEIEKPLLESVLRETNNNISQSAEILGLNRGTLRKKLQKYSLSK